MRISDWSSDVCSSDLADPAKGVAYLERAHKAGIPSATARLGEAYLEGRGVPQDPGKAIPLLQQAAEAGQPGAMMALGQGYLRSEEHTSELQSLMRISYAVFCLNKKTDPANDNKHTERPQAISTDTFALLDTDNR